MPLQPREQDPESLYMHATGMNREFKDSLHFPNHSTNLIAEGPENREDNHNFTSRNMVDLQGNTYDERPRREAIREDRQRLNETRQHSAHEVNGRGGGTVQPSSSRTVRSDREGSYDAQPAFKRRAKRSFFEHHRR